MKKSQLYLFSYVGIQRETEQPTNDILPLNYPYAVHSYIIPRSLVKPSYQNLLFLFSL